MPTKNPRISAVLEPEIADWLRRSAREQGISVSLLVRDLLKRIHEEEEERFLAGEGESRLGTFDRKTAVDHGRAWE